MNERAKPPQFGMILQSGGARLIYLRRGTFVVNRRSYTEAEIGRLTVGRVDAINDHVGCLGYRVAEPEIDVRGS